MRLALLGVCLAVATARADVALTPELRDGFVPTLEARIIGEPLVPADTITVRGIDDRDAVTASLVRAYADGPEPIAIVIVVNGQEIFMGNDDVEKDENAKYWGILKHLEEVLDRLDPKTLAPAGSNVMVVAYSTGAKVIWPMRPLAELRGSMLGTQRDYRGAIGTDMVEGIRLGMAALEHTVITRKALIVIGDGNDTNNEAARLELDELGAEAAKARIETYALIYKSAISSEHEVISRMIPAPITVSSILGLEPALISIKARLTDRYYVTFAATALPWDGGDHELVVRLDKRDLEPMIVKLPGRPSRSPLWRWLLIGGGGLLVLGLVALRRRPRFALG